MGDSSSIQAYAELQHQPSHPPTYLPAPPVVNHRQDPISAPLVNGDDEDYTIKCICGYADDDGNTVFCEKCESWQHILCYYHPREQLEENFHHICVDCAPRNTLSLDPHLARERQRQLREPASYSDDRKSDDKRVKKSGARGHKKSKTKDLTNGWVLHDTTARDGVSGSPRDAGPPAKKTKTSHKASPSLTTNFRNRSSSHLPPARILPPNLHHCPPDWFSPHFIRVHRENKDFAETDTNLHVNIATTNLLSTLLDDEEIFAAHTNGRSHNDVFKKFPGTFEELGVPSWHVEEEIEEDAQFHGDNPIWKKIVVDQDLSSGQFFGELTGSIGPLKEYKEDPANKWDVLHHPDYFVFFHPALPIYIDCRSEGTKLRYIRRSCKPNLRMETLITGDREYRFIFTAAEDISLGEEVSIGWDAGYLNQSLEHLRNTNERLKLDPSNAEFLHNWSQTLLEHFGGCPCDKVKGPPCLLDHFDRRLPKLVAQLEARHVKNGKKRKASRKESPRPEHLLSRASSEAIARDDEDDMEDTRSTTQSSRSDNSRDATPNGTKHFGSELSEREKKKLLQQERLFEQMEHDQQHGSKRRKRTSGSNVNTPTIETSKHIDRYSAYTHNPDLHASGLKPRVTEVNGLYHPANQRRSANGGTTYRPSPSGRSASGQSANGSPRVAPRPLYVDASTQTDPETPSVPSPTATTSPHKPMRTSLAKRVLKRSLLRSINDLQGAMKTPPMPISPLIHASTPPVQPAHSSEKTSSEVMDVEMEDISTHALSQDTVKAENLDQPAAITSISAGTSLPAHPPIKPPPPPWQSNAPILTEQPARDVRASKSPHLHVELPPPPNFSARADADSMTSATSAVTPTPLAPSPSNSDAAPMMSPPAPDALTKPTPIKKKMSLSDYRKRRAIETPSLEKTQSQAEAEVDRRSSGGKSVSPGVEGSDVKAE